MLLLRRVRHKGVAPVAGEPTPAGDDPRDSTSIESRTVDVVFVAVVTPQIEMALNWFPANATHCMWMAQPVHLSVSMTGTHLNFILNALFKVVFSANDRRAFI